MSSNVKNIIFLFLASASLLISCETSNNVDDPTKSYFTKYFGSDGDQEGIDMVVDDTDGSFYLLGNTKNTTGQNLYIVKADRDGRVIWEKTIDGVNDYEAKDIEITSDRRLVILANYEVKPGDIDIFILTKDINGTSLDSTFFGYSGFIDDASSITQISDGFIVAGSTTNTNLKPTNNPLITDQKDALFARFLDDLTVADNLWKTTAGPGTVDVAIKVLPIVSSPGNSTEFYVFGYSNKSGGTQTDKNFWYFGLNKFGENPAGDWTAGSAADDEILSSAILNGSVPGTGYILAGNAVNATDNHLYITKLRNQLKFNDTDYQFRTKLDNVNLGSPDLSKVSVYASATSGYLILANEKGTSKNNFLLHKMNTDGGLEWSDPVIFGGLNDDYIGAVKELPDGKIVLLGTMSLGNEAQKKMVLIKVNKDGKFLD